MVNLASLQSKINKKIFDALGSDLLLTVNTVSSTDKWGDATLSSSSSTVKVVPWANMKSMTDYQPFGDLQAGEVDMAFKYDVTLAKGYTAVLNGITYVIRDVEDFPLKNGILVKVARLTRQL